jgi:hypothetical protein
MDHLKNNNPPGFEWRTEEDGKWPEMPPAPESRPLPARWRRWLLLLAGVLVVAGLMGYRQLRQRVSLVENAAAQDVVAAHTLVRQAVERGDGELYRSLLDDPRGLAGQRRQMMDEGFFYQRSTFGLGEAIGEPEVVEVKFAPDLLTAELIWRQSFRLSDDGREETVTLQRADLYRRQAERWLLAEPGREFWGDWQTAEGGFLHLIYPERDAAVARRLLPDLDDLLGQLCRRLDAGTDCESSRRPLQIRLATDPISLKKLHDAPGSVLAMGTNSVSAQRAMDLPTPSLLGAPLTESGYQLVYRTYGRLLVSALLQQFISSQQPWHNWDSLQIAALESHLVEMGLQSWPPPPTQPPGLQQAATTPSADLLMMCAGSATAGETATGADLYRYQFASQQWQLEDELTGLYSLHATPGGQGVILMAQTPVDGRPRGQIWYRYGATTTLLQDFAAHDPDARFYPWLGWPDPAGNYMLFSRYSGAGRTNWFAWDLAACRSGPCEALFLLGDTRWSPDGRRTLVSSYSHPVTTALGDERGQNLQPLSSERADGAFTWLDTDRYAFVHTPYRARQGEGPLTGGEVVVKNVDSGESEVWLTAADLLAALPVDLLPAEFNIAFLWPVPGQPDKVAIVATGMGSWQLTADTGYARDLRYFLFVLDAGAEPTVEYLALRWFVPHFRFSADGRFLAWSDFDGEFSDWRLHLYSLADGSFKTVAVPARSLLQPAFRFGFDLNWSPDGRWLLAHGLGLLLLLEPESDSWLPLTLPAPGCVTAAWMDK